MNTKKQAAPERVLLAPKTLAVRWDTTPAALQQLRRRGTGPRFIRWQTKMIRYPLAEVEHYERQVFADVGEAQTFTDPARLERQRAAMNKARSARLRKVLAMRAARDAAQP
jgi:hypothetical protein